MTNPLEDLARRAENDPFYLAATLRWFAISESLTDEALAQCLGCDRETLVKVRLCGTPAKEPKAFANDIAQIAEKFGLDEAALTKAVRRGRVGMELQSASRPRLAARDRKPEEPE